MHVTLTETLAPATTVTPQERRRRFISAYWLRPENALWMILRSDALSKAAMRGPCIDLCCGDGVFSFLHAGGRFAPEFDVFHGVGRLDQIDSENADIFDYVDDEYQPSITTPPAYRIECGTDHKDNLIAKAARLDLYNRLVRTDHNDALPFDADSFETVYCNAVYWIERIDTFLGEIRRVTRPGGTVIFQVKLDHIHDCTLRRHRDQLGDRWLDIIDRGRAESWPSLCDRSTWERRFKSAGLEIVRETPFVTRTHAHIWDIGLRPIAPMLIKTMAAIHPHLRREIKRDWVDLFCRLLEPFCKPDLDLFTADGEPIEVQYELTPKT